MSEETQQPPEAGQDAPAEQPPAPQPVDPEDDGGDSLFFEAPETPERYQFDRPPPGVEFDRAQDAEMRQLFHAEGIPNGTAKYVSAAWNKAAANPPTQAEIDAKGRATQVQLQRLWGADYEKNVAYARSEVERITARNPKVRDMLQVSGLGNDAWLIQHLALRGRIRASRSK